MLPPSQWQNKALHFAARLLFFTCSRANVFRSSCTRLAACTEHTSCSIMYCIWKYTQKHTQSTFCSQSASSCRHKTLLSSDPLPLLSLFPLSGAPSPRLSSCLPLSSSPFFRHLSRLSAEQQREAAIDAHALGPLLLPRRVEGEIIKGEREGMRGKRSSNIASRH